MGRGTEKRLFWLAVKSCFRQFGKNLETDAKLPEACLGAKKHDSLSAYLLID